MALTACKDFTENSVYGIKARASDPPCFVALKRNEGRWSKYNMVLDSGLYKSLVLA